MKKVESIAAIREVPVKDHAGAARLSENEFAASYCPRCSAKLEARSCKMICSSCGYYMSCSDFY